jgi:hypothetical protein
VSQRHASDRIIHLLYGVTPAHPREQAMHAALTQLQGQLGKSMPADAHRQAPSGGGSR